MSKLQLSDQLMKQILAMDRENSVVQFRIPGKGRFTLVLQEEEERSISADVEANPHLGKMILDSKEQYKNGLWLSKQELLKSLSDPETQQMLKKAEKDIEEGRLYSTDDIIEAIENGEM